jgi:predicted nucleic acid-binding protein
MSAERSLYLDSSALVKLVIHEPESRALRARLESSPERVSSALARVEVPRAVRAHGARARQRARATLARVSLIRIDDALLDAAAELGPPVRSLDAIHLASAGAVGGDLAALVTYDVRMARAAGALGMPVEAPK